MDSKIARVAVGVVGASALVIGLAACSSAEPTAATSDGTESSAAPSSVDSDADGTLDEFDYAPSDPDVQRQEDIEPAAPVPAPAPPTPEPVAPVAPVEQPATVTVPNVTGMSYQDAQDLLRANGLVVYPATDGLGADRIPVLDANWYVVAQDIEAGTTVDSGTGVTCTILKYTDN